MAPAAWSAFRRGARDRASRVLYAAGLTRPERSAAALLTVITFHRVLPEELLGGYPLPQLAVTTDELTWMVAFLREHFTCETLSDACRRWRASERPDRPLLALTFDDGQLDNFLHARPVLDRSGVRGTFFIPVDAVDRDQLLWHDRLAYASHRLLAADRPAARRLLRELGVTAEDEARASPALVVARAKQLPEPERRAFVERTEVAAGGGVRPPWDGMMTWAQLRALSDGGHEIGSHSLSHPLLPGLDAAGIEREVAGSKERLQSALGLRCESFCYPNGDCDRRVVEAVGRAGYRQAVVTRWGPNAPGVDRFQLTRCELQGRTSRDRGGRLSAEVVALRLSPLFARFRR